MDNIQMTQRTIDPCLPVGLADNYVSPILRSKPYRNGEDWTGATKAMRRKLQNRINQRAYRIRKSRSQSNVETASSSDDTLANQVVRKPTARPLAKSHNAQLDLVTLLQASNVVMMPMNRDSSIASDTIEELTPSTALTAPGKGVNKPPRLTSLSYHTIILARDFNSYYRNKNTTPLSSDHLLTLMVFNAIRAHTLNIHILGLTEEEFIGDDALSPFNANSPLASKLPKVLPLSFYPTHMQKTVPHHPEVDFLPWPQIRDNIILAQGTYDDYQFCGDMIGVKCSRETGGIGEEHPLESKTNMEGEPGLIVWNDPWRPESWEASEALVKNWGWLLKGCRELLESTNYWREKRGEKKLFWEM